MTDENDTGNAAEGQGAEEVEAKARRLAADAANAITLLAIHRHMRDSPGVMRAFEVAEYAIAALVDPADEARSQQIERMRAAAAGYDPSTRAKRAQWHELELELDAATRGKAASSKWTAPGDAVRRVRRCLADRWPDRFPKKDDAAEGAEARRRLDEKAEACLRAEEKEACLRAEEVEARRLAEDAWLRDLLERLGKGRIELSGAVADVLMKFGLGGERRNGADHDEDSLRRAVRAAQRDRNRP